MKSIFKAQFIFAFVLGALFLASCSNENEGVFTPEEETKYKLVVVPTENPDSLKLRNLEVVSGPGTLVTVDVNFKKGPNPMRRLYMTKNGEPFEYPIGSKKRDGSINLDGKDKDEFNFQMRFDAPSKNGEVVKYVLWATKEQGDFRDISNDNAINKDPNNPAYGTITIKADENAVEGSIKSFSTLLVSAPSLEGISPSFMSAFNGTRYKIAEYSIYKLNADGSVLLGKDGKPVLEEASTVDQNKALNAEVVKLWDFGYYYGATNKASFASASNYPSNIVDIKKYATVTDDQLNKFYFRKSTLDFDAVTKAEDFNFEKPTAERITGLAVGDVIEFEDSYGNKGLIKITGLNEGDGYDPAKTPEENDHIAFDMKVQVQALPIKQ